MNRQRLLELARADLASRKRACADAWRIEGIHPEHIFFAAHNFHRECQELRLSEARLAALEAEAT